MNSSKIGVKPTINKTLGTKISFSIINGTKAQIILFYKCVDALKNWNQKIKATSKYITIMFHMLN